MKAGPILFSEPMVRALLEGRKTQTRRVVKPQPNDSFSDVFLSKEATGPTRDFFYQKSRHGKPGDLLWVREAWAHGYTCAGEFPCVFYRADDGCRLRVPDGTEEAGSVASRPPGDVRWKPSIHMFRRDSRLTLRITDVRLERVQEISEADAKAEGATFGAGSKEELAVGCRIGFAALWDTINSGRGFGWNTNPWVWVVEFEVGQASIIPEGK